MKSEFRRSPRRLRQSPASRKRPRKAARTFPRCSGATRRRDAAALPANDRQAFCRIKHLPLAAVEAIACKHVLRSSRGHLRKDRLPTGKAYIGRPRPPPRSSRTVIPSTRRPSPLPAAVFALLALITGLVALYGWLEPTYGVFPALSIVGGVLAVIALVLISAAMILSRRRPGSEKGTATPETIEVPPSPLPLLVTPAPIRFCRLVSVRSLRRNCRR